MKSAGSEGTKSTSDEGTLRQMVRRSRLPVLLFRLEQGRILEVSDSLVALFGGSRDDMVGRPALEFVVDDSGARARLALMAGGELDGYHVLGRRFRRPDGAEFSIDTFVRGFGDPPLRSAVGMLMPHQREGRTAPATIPDPSGAVVLGAVNAAWQIDRISANVRQLLGYSPSDLIGKSLAAFIEPSDLPSLLVGVGRGVQAPGGTTIRVRFRVASGSCRPCRMLVTQLAGDAADDLGFAFAITDLGLTPVVDRTWELERALQHIAREIEATGVLAGLWGAPAITKVPALADLSARELDIVTKLLAGDRVPLIAQQLFLSESTVRNHLTSVYRKLGVRSQQQLLNLLRRGQAHANSGDVV